MIRVIVRVHYSDFCVLSGTSWLLRRSPSISVARRVLDSSVAIRSLATSQPAPVTAPRREYYIAEEML